MRRAWHRAALLTLAIVLLCTSAARAKRLEKSLTTLGPYRLGTSYDEMQGRTGFTADPARSRPSQGELSAKIIDKKIADTPTIQRFTFRQGKLVRVSILFGDTAWDEDRVKTYVAGQHGDPGEKVDGKYVWIGNDGNLVVVLFGDGGRWMASLVQRR